MQGIDSINQLSSGDYLILYKEQMADLDKTQKKYTTEYTGDDFHVTQLSLQFLNPPTRWKEVKPYVVVKIK